MTLLISVNGMPWRNFSKSTVAHAKVGHVSQTTPLLGVICHPFGQDLSYHVQNLKALATAIPEIWMGPPEFNKGHVT